MQYFLRIVMISVVSILWSNRSVASDFLDRHLTPYYSQASQDRFVDLIFHGLLGKVDRGYYLEIGAAHPFEINNSFFFEKNFGWQGVSIDISPEHKAAWEIFRTNPLLVADATQLDYRSLLMTFPKVIDYLSLDIDHDYDIVLNKIPFDEHVFSIITIEHDFYRFGDQYREGERKILESLGYYLLCPDVSLYFSDQENKFEDWWIYPDAFPQDIFLLLTSLDWKDNNHMQVITKIQNAIKNERLSKYGKY